MENLDQVKEEVYQAIATLHSVAAVLEGMNEDQEREERVCEYLKEQYGCEYIKREDGTYQQKEAYDIYHDVIEDDVEEKDGFMQDVDDLVDLLSKFHQAKMEDMLS